MKAACFMLFTLVCSEVVWNKSNVTIHRKSHKNATFRHCLSYLYLPTIFIRPKEAMDKVCSSLATFKGVYSLPRAAGNSQSTPLNSKVE